MRKATAIVIALATGTCAGQLPTSAPCGVIVDSLKDVLGKRPSDVKRLDFHFERGVAAGCWRRQDKPRPVA